MKHSNIIIGVTPQFDIEKNNIWMRPQYTDAILHAGGLPVLLVQYQSIADIEKIADILDGILFTGGVDVHPSRYGEEIDPQCGTIAVVRDEFELKLYEIAARRKIPVMGICRGIQLINVAEGGTLHQHIDGHTYGTEHKVEILRGSQLYKILQTDSAITNSSHHQAVKIPAPTMEICAYSTDGTVEAICKKAEYGHYSLGVQWHPEYGYESGINEKLFLDFISHCRK